MKAVVQRVTRASVTSEGELLGSIGRGALVLLGVLEGDGEEQAEQLARNVATFRIFPDERQRMGRSLLDVDGQALVVSQFTLAADGRKGRRPSFERAAAPAVAGPLVAHFVARLRDLGVATDTGRFGAMMAVELVNDGPVTFVLETP